MTLYAVIVEHCEEGEVFVSGPFKDREAAYAWAWNSAKSAAEATADDEGQGEKAGGDENESVWVCSAVDESEYSMEFTIKELITAN
jgi:hypothetical protein